MKSIKTFFLGFLIATILFTFIPISAAVQEYILQESDCTLTIDGQVWESSGLPMLNYGGYNYIPVTAFKDIAEQLGADFEYDNDTKTINITSAPQEQEPVIEEPEPEDPPQEPKKEEPAEPEEEQGEVNESTEQEEPQEPELKYYYFRITDGVIDFKDTKTTPVFADNEIEVPKALYDELTSFPAYYEADSEGNIISITPVYIPPKTTNYYYVEIENGIITGTGSRKLPLNHNDPDNYKAITKEIYEQLTSLPAIFETDENGNIISVSPIN